MQGTMRRRTVLFALSASTLLLASSALADGARSFKSGTIQVTADGSAVWTANAELGSITRLLPSTLRTTPFTISGCEPRGLSLREEENQAWLTCPDDDRVVVFDTGNGSIQATIPLPHGSGPAFVAISPDGAHAIVTLHRGDGVALIDTTSFDVAVAKTRRAPEGVAWSLDGRSAWVSHAFSDGQRTFVTRIDVSGGRPVVGATIPLPEQFPTQSGPTLPIRGSADGGEITLRGQLAQIPAASGSRDIWLPAQHSLTRQPNPDMTTTIHAAVQRLDPAAGVVDPSRRIVLSSPYVHDQDGNESPGWNLPLAGLVDVAFTADGATAWMVAENSENVVALPTDATASRDPAAPVLVIDVGKQPTGIALDPTGDGVFVLNSLSRTISMIDGSTGNVSATIPLGVLEVVPQNILTGRHVFHTSALSEVSGNKRVSCASCHFEGEHDGLIWHFENLSTPLGPRPTTSMLGLSLTFGPRDPVTGLGQLHRSGDRDEVQDFEHTFRGQQMGGTGFFVAPPNPYEGAPNEGHDPNVDAMAAYMLSLPAPQRSPHRAADGSLTPAAVRGAAIFMGAGMSAGDGTCATCHDPSRGFSDRAFHDVGSSRLPEERQINSRFPVWQVNTPTLIGLWSTAPYDDAGKDGEQVQDLLDVLKTFDQRSGGVPLHGHTALLSRRQLEDLAELVLSIDGETSRDELVAAVDRTPPHLVRVEPVSLTRIDCFFDEAVTQSAASPGNWRVRLDDGSDLRITGVDFDAEWGDRVTLTVDPMPQACRGRTITVIPGPIADTAGTITGRYRNALDTSDPSNTHSFTLGETITVTLGATGRENIQVAIHDAAMAGPDAEDASEDEAWMKRIAGPVSTRGFVRFEWEDAFRQATGVTDPSRIVDASIALAPEWGAAQTIVARRMLQRWNDAHGGDGDVTTIGPPTWREHGRGLGAWNSPGGLAMGGTGGTLTDYFGAYDVAATSDATLTLASLDPAVLRGAGVADAMRFWLANPQADMGYALELATGTSSELRLRRAGPAFGEGSPVLTITYSLPPQSDPVPEIAGDASPQPLKVRRDAAGALVVSFGDEAPGGDYQVFEGTLGAFQSHAGLGCAAVAPDGSGRLAVTITPATGDRYLLVGASSPCGGSLGADSFGVPHGFAIAACTR